MFGPNWLNYSLSSKVLDYVQPTPPNLRVPTIRLINNFISYLFLYLTTTKDIWHYASGPTLVQHWVNVFCLLGCVQKHDLLPSRKDRRMILHNCHTVLLMQWWSHTPILEGFSVSRWLGVFMFPIPFGVAWAYTRSITCIMLTINLVWFSKCPIVTFYRGLFKLIIQ